MNQGYYLDLKLFLEGIQVPVIGASVTATIGSPASANIEIVPDDSLDLLLPRTVVHLFYLDHVQFKKSGRQTPADTDYKLLFCGELFGISSSKAGMGSRGTTLSCLDFSNVLDTNYVYQVQITPEDNPGNSIIRDTSIFLGAENSLFDNIGVNQPSEVIRRAMTKSPSMPQHSGKQTLLGGLLSILEILCGVQGLSYGINQFASVQERRTRLLESIVGDSGETATQVFEVSQFSDWLTKRLAQQGQVMSFRQLTSIVFEYIFYSMVPNPCARYLPGNSTDSPGKPNRDVPKFASLRGVVGELTAEERAEYDEFVVSADLSIQSEFHEEVMPFLKELNEWLTNGNLHSGEPAQLVLSSAFREPGDDGYVIAHEWGLAIDFVFTYRNGAEEKGSPSSWDVGLPHKFHKDGEPIKDVDSTGTWYKNLRRALFVLGEVPATVELLEQKWAAPLNFLFRSQYPGGETRFRQDIKIAKDYRKFCTEAAKMAQKYNLTYLGDPSRKSSNAVTGETCPLLVGMMGIGWDPVHVEMGDWGVGKYGVTTKRAVEAINPKVGDREALYTHVLRPDVWFSPPPKSNVIFPDMIQSFSTGRELMRETSRLQLDIGNALASDSSAVLNRYFFAPQLKDLGLAAALGQRATEMVIFDHEKFSGIIPKFERMTDSLYYGLKNPGQELATTEGQETLGTYASKVAHFHLLTSRYMARSASLSLSISPHIIPGFPAVVIDSTMTSPEVAMADALSSPGTAQRSFKLGMVQSVTHSISQSGAQTQVRLSQVRSHRTGSQSDDVLSEVIGSDGTLTVQDESQTAIEVSGKADLSIGGAVTTFGASSFGDDSFLWAGIAAVYGFSSLENMLTSVVIIPRSGSPAVLSVEDTPSSAVAHFDLEQPRYSLSDVTYKGKEVTSVLWSAGQVDAVIRVKNFAVLDGDFASDATVESQSGQEIRVDRRLPTDTDVIFPANLTFEEIIDSRGLIGILLDDGTLVVPVALPGGTLEPAFSDAVGRSSLLPVEEAIRPVWISDDYSADNITNKIYGPFFGTAAITDLVTESKYSMRSVEEAVDLIALRYAKKAASQADDGMSQDTLTYIYDFTRRPIANQLEVLAEKSLFYDTGARTFKSTPSSDSEEAQDLKYHGGYHSNAVCFGAKAKYGDKLEYLDLKGLDLTSKLSASGSATFSLDGPEGDRMDPRLERAARVDLYKSRIQGVSGASGIGKRG